MSQNTLLWHNYLTTGTPRENLIFKIANQISSVSNLNTVLNTVATEVCKLLKADRTFISRSETNDSGQIMAESVSKICWSLQTQNIPALFWQSLESAPDAMAIADIYLRPHNYIALLATFQVRASLRVPIWTNGKIWGYLIVDQCTKSRNWLQEEVDLLKMVSVHLAIAIQQDNLLQKRANLLNRTPLNPQYSEVSFRALVANLPGAIYRCAFDQYWTIQFISNAIEDIAGYQPLELIQNRVFSYVSLIHPEDVNTVEKEILAAVSQYKPFILEYRIIHRDGSIRWVYEKGRGKFDDQGNLLWLDGAIFDISDRKATEIALQEKTEELDRFFSIALDLLCIADLEGRFLRLNPQWEITLGYPLNELEGRFYLELVHPDDIKNTKKAITYLSQKNSVLNFVNRYQAKDGSYRWIEWRCTPVGDRIYAAARDITSRKQSEIALQESEEKFRQLAENIHQVFFITKITGEMLYVSPAYEEIWQESRDSLYQNSSSWLTCIHPEDRKAMGEALNKQIKEGVVFEQTYRIIRPDGEIRWIESRAFPVEDKQGKIYRYAGIAEDITNRKNIQQSLHNQLQKTLLLQKITEEIRQSLDVKEIFTTAAKQISQALKINCCLIHTYQTNPKPHATLVAQYSQIKCKILESLEPKITFDENPYIKYLISQDRAISSNEDDCSIKLSDMVSLSSVLYTNKPVAEHKKLKSMLAIATFYHGKPNGIISLHQCDYNRVWNLDEIELIEAVARQLGIAIAQGELLSQEQQQRLELTQKNIKLKRMTQEAKAANSAKSEFLANMSHEIRTPMNAVLGFADLLQSTITDPKASSYIDAIASSGRTLLALINDILDLSKIESGKLQLHYEPVNIRTVINEIEHIFHQKATEKKLKLKVFIDPKLPYTIIMDEVRLRQILFNIVGNSIKFTEVGSVKIIASCSELDQHHPQNSMHLKIAITDTGIGISPEDQQKIFDSFTQSEGQSNRKYGGTGLGLTITQRLVHLLGGSIHLESKPNQGSTFICNFPNTKISTETTTLSPIITLDDNLQQFQLATILVVDDVPSNRDLLADYFANTHHQILCAKDGKEAIKLAQVYQPDIILMDLRMPYMDGREASQFLKQNKLTSHIPIILLTASPQHGSEQNLRQLCDGFLAKPVNKTQIVGELKKFLQSIQSEQKSDKLPSNSVVLKPVRLPELAAKLREQVEVNLPHLRETLVTRELKQFIQNLEMLAEEHQSKVLLDYVETLKQQLQDFDWDHIPKTVAQFAEIPEQLIIDN